MDKFLDTIQPFWIGGASGMSATCVIQPIDMIKVVIQLKSEKGEKATFGSAFKDILSKDGIRGFYRGYHFTNLESIQLSPDNSFTPQLDLESIKLLLKLSTRETKPKDKVPFS